jgi:hypothetical protein
LQASEFTRFGLGENRDRTKYAIKLLNIKKVCSKLIGYSNVYLKFFKIRIMNTKIKHINLKLILISNSLSLGFV